MTAIRLNFRSRSGTKQIFIWMFGLGVLLGVALLLMLLAPSTKAGSSYDQSPWGSQAFYHYLQGLAETQPGLEVQRWQRDYKNLTGKNQVLFKIGDQRQLQTQGFSSDTLDWIEAGNTLILLTWDGNIKSPDPSVQIPTPVGPVQVDTRRREEVKPGTHPSDFGETARLLGDVDGAVLWSVKTEQGKIIYGVYPWFVANAYDHPKFENFAYFAELAQAAGGQIWFDEWLHGYRVKDPTDLPADVSYSGVLDYLRRTPWLLVLLQAIVFGVIMLWGKNHRLGALIRERPPTQANSEQYIQALASVLQKAQHQDFVQAQLSQRLRQELAEKLGLRGAWVGHDVSFSDQELAQAWSAQTGKSPQDLMIVIGPTPEELTEQELLAWLNRVEQVLRGLR